LEEQSGVERGMLIGGTEWTGEGNVGWRNRTDWRTKCLLEEQSGLENYMLTGGKYGLESGMLTGGTERTGGWNVD